MQEMTWEDFQSFTGRGGVIVVPVGSTEQHGLHLPLGVDAIIPYEIAKKLAEKADVVVAPQIAWGYKPQPGSSGGTDFPGTCSLDGGTLSSLVRDFVRELVRHRVRKIIILDGHYENSMFLIEGADLALRDSNRPANVKVVVARWFDLIKPTEFDKIFPNFEGIALEHAANMETAMLLYFRPELVKQDKIKGDSAERNPPYIVLPPTKDLIPSTGVLTKIKTVNSKQGEEMTRLAVSALLELIKTEFT
ncbi:MAG TPA: creatininase [Terriglobales bacterium]|nr:creatininase [Terriglobales bacterium]